jgi:hypothetical protein
MRFSNEAEIRELVRRFETCQLPLQEFSHRAHVAVATTFLIDDDRVALERMRSGLMRFTAHYGKENKYSEEITRKWMEKLNGFVSTTEGRDVLTLVNRAIERFGSGYGRDIGQG